MKKEKNVIFCSIFALVIGAAAIAPLALFMDTAKAQLDDDSWFNIDVSYAYFSADVTDDIFQATGVIAFDAIFNRPVRKLNMLCCCFKV
jgi:hypothetical protein